MKIPLTEPQAEAIRLAITENQALLRELNLRIALARRAVNVHVIDAKGDPQLYDDYALAKEGEQMFLVMQSPQAPTPLPPAA